MRLALGAVLAVIGLLLVVATGTMTTLLMIIVALFLMVLGVLAIVGNLDAGNRRRNTALAVGIVLIVLGVLLLVYPNATSDTFIRVLGVVMVLVSALSVYSYIR